MNIDDEIIRIGIWLKQQKSACHYNDYLNVWKSNFGSKISYQTVERRLRALRKLGFFMTPPNLKGQFFVADFMINGGEKIEADRQD